MALSDAKIRFAKYQAEFTRAYIKGEYRTREVYATLLQNLFLEIFCGGVAL